MNRTKWTNRSLSALIALLLAGAALSQPTSIVQVPDAAGPHFESARSLLERYGLRTILRNGRLETAQPITTEEVTAQLEEARQQLIGLRSASFLGDRYLTHLNQPHKDPARQLAHPFPFQKPPLRGPWLDWLDQAMEHNLQELSSRSTYENLARDFFQDFEKLSPQQRLLHLDALNRWHSGDVRFQQRLSRRWEFIQARVQALAAVGRPKEAIGAMQAGYEANLSVVQQSLTNRGSYQEGKEAYEQALEILKSGRYCLSSLGLSEPVLNTQLLQQFKQRYP